MVDDTRRVLKLFGVAVTQLEEAIASREADTARRAAANLAERMREITALVGRLSKEAASL